MLKKLVLVLLCFLVTGCKPESPSVDLLDVDLGAPINTIVSPDEDQLVGDIFNWSVNISALSPGRYSLAGAPIGALDEPDSFLRGVEFQLYSPKVVEYGVAEWHRKYVFDVDNDAWTARDDPEPVPEDEREERSIWKRTDIETEEALNSFVQDRQAWDGLTGIIVTVREDDARFEALSRAIQARLGAPAPAENYGNKDRPGLHWVLDDRVVIVAPAFDVIVIKALNQAKYDCLPALGAVMIDLGGCEPAAIPVTEISFGLPQPTD